MTSARIRESSKLAGDLDTLKAEYSEQPSASLWNDVNWRIIQKFAVFRHHSSNSRLLIPIWVRFGPFAFDHLEFMIPVDWESPRNEYADAH